jgi:uncharacterized membrane protein
MAQRSGRFLFISVILFFLSLVTGMADLPVNASVYEYIFFRFSSLALAIASILILFVKWRKSGYFYKIFSCLLFIVNSLNITLTLLNLNTDFALAIR